MARMFQEEEPKEAEAPKETTEETAAPAEEEAPKAE